MEVQMPTIIHCSKKDDQGKRQKVVDHGKKMSGLSSVIIIPCSFKKRCEVRNLDPANTTRHELECIEYGLNPAKTNPENLARRKKWPS